MTLSLDENSSNYQIRAYKPGLIQINDQQYHRSLIVSANKLITDWSPQRFADLTEEDFAIFLELKPGILLLGTGATLQFPPLQLYGKLLNEKIGVEIMDTGAACRTYTALSAEDRNVVAALIIE